MHGHRLLLSCAALLLSVVGLGAQTNGVREVSASERTLISLTTKLRYTTMILLPEQEEILDVVCGDRDFWVISAAQHIAHVKPAKEGAATNLNLVTASGRVYSFLLTEQKGAPDLKVYVTADPSVATGPKKFYSAADMSALQAEVTSARTAADAARQRADEAIASFKRQYPAALQFVYPVSKYERPFFVRSVWHDGVNRPSYPLKRLGVLEEFLIRSTLSELTCMHQRTPLRLLAQPLIRPTPPSN